MPNIQITNTKYLRFGWEQSQMITKKREELGNEK